MIRDDVYDEWARDVREDRRSAADQAEADAAPTIPEWDRGDRAEADREASR